MIQVIRLIQVIKVMQVRLAHLWVVFWDIFIWVLRTVQWRIYHLIFQDAAITSNTFLLITISSSIFKDNATSMHIILDSSKWDSKGKAAWKWNTKCLNKGAAVQCTMTMYTVHSHILLRTEMWGFILSCLWCSTLQ